MRIRIENPALPFDLEPTGAIELFQQYLQAKVECWIGFSMDFGSGLLVIDTETDVETLLFSELGESEVVEDV